MFEWIIAMGVTSVFFILLFIAFYKWISKK